MVVGRRLMGIGVFLVLLAALVAPRTARATPPTRDTFPIFGTFILAECDGFNVIDEYEGWATVTQFFDRRGNLTRIGIHANTQDRITNSVTGFEEWTNFAFNETIDPATKLHYIRGLGWNITVPHYGRVYFDAGLGIWLETEGGFVRLRFSGLLDVDEARLCAAMDQ